MKTLLILSTLLLAAAPWGQAQGQNVPATARDVMVYWNANAREQNVTAYRLYLKKGAVWERLTEVTGVTETTVKLPVEPSDVAITAVNAAGLESARSEPLKIPLSPDPPSGLRIKITIQIDTAAP